MSSQRNYRVLLAGIDPKSVAAKFPQIDGDKLAKDLDASFAKVRSVPNLKTDILWLFLEDKQPAEVITKALKETSYDAVLIGWGVRGLPENSALFEACVDAVRRDATLDTKLVFSTSADDHLEAFARNLPGLDVSQSN